MNIKLSILTAAVLACTSGIAMAQNPPTAPSPLYDLGPQSPQVAKTDLSLAERTAYANYEAILQIAEARIHAWGCSQSAGTFTVEAFSDGAVGSPFSNTALVTSPGGLFQVDATSAVVDPSQRGQQIAVNLTTGVFNNKSVTNYAGQFAYNYPNNMMDGQSSVNITGLNGRPDRYDGKVIKDFYRGAVSPTNTDGSPNPEFYTIYDWGLQSVDKFGFPANKYWQRSKSLRSDGGLGHTVFVKDRLVGATSCRIVIDTTGDNNPDFFSQSGVLKIQPNVLPGAPVPEFTF